MVPKVNVYLPDDLARAVRDAGIPISAVCQQALADAVAAADGAPAPTGGDDDKTETWSKVTKRARHALEFARHAGRERDGKPNTVDLVAGLIDEGDNLALPLLRTLDVEPDDLLTELRARERRRGTPRAGGLRTAGERAMAEAVRLEHNYVGCEHLLLGLATGPDDELTAATLRDMGIDADAARRAVAVALAGYGYARENITFSGLSAPIRAALDEIRARLARLENR